MITIKIIKTTAIALAAAALATTILAGSASAKRSAEAQFVPLLVVPPAALHSSPGQRYKHG